MAWHRWCASSPTWGSSAKRTRTRAPRPLGPWFKWSARSQRPHLDPGRGGVCRQGLDILLPRLSHGAVGRRAARSQRNRHPDRPVGVTVNGGGRGRGPRLLGGLPGARRPHHHSDGRPHGRPTRRWVGPACPVNPVCALRAVRSLGVPDIPRDHGQAGAGGLQHPRKLTGCRQRLGARHRPPERPQPPRSLRHADPGRVQAARPLTAMPPATPPEVPPLAALQPVVGQRLGGGARAGGGLGAHSRPRSANGSPDRAGPPRAPNDIVAPL